MAPPPRPGPTMPTTLAQLTQRLTAFRDQRDWQQFHTLKNLLVSLSVEAGELLELAQWKDDDALHAALAEPDFHRRLSEEMADVFIYLLLICEKTDIDLTQAALDKMEINEARYPAEKVRGSARKYTEY